MKSLAASSIVLCVFLFLAFMQSGCGKEEESPPAPKAAAKEPTAEQSSAATVPSPPSATPTEQPSQATAEVPKAPLHDQPTKSPQADHAGGRERAGHADRAVTQGYADDRTTTLPESSGEKAGKASSSPPAPLGAETADIEEQADSTATMPHGSPSTRTNAEGREERAEPTGKKQHTVLTQKGHEKILTEGETNPPHIGDGASEQAASFIAPPNLEEATAAEPEVDKSKKKEIPESQGGHFRY